MVIYFTGTGNSKYIAKQIAKNLKDLLTDSTKMIKEEKYPRLTSENPYIFVAPAYAWRLPRIFTEFIKKCKFEGNRKAYFVLTCGSEIGAASKYIERFASKIGFEYMGTAEIIMPKNYLVMFNPPPKEKYKEIINTASLNTVKLCKQIAEGSNFDKSKCSLIGYIESGIVNSFFYTFYIGAKKFYATDACISCRKCVENCIMNNIVLKDGKPAWGNNCTHCMACICKCPCEAIEYGKNTVGKHRYIYS